MLDWESREIFGFNSCKHASCVQGLEVKGMHQNFLCRNRTRKTIMVTKWKLQKRRQEIAETTTPFHRLESRRS